MSFLDNIKNQATSALGNQGGGQQAQQTQGGAAPAQGSANPAQAGQATGQQDALDKGVDQLLTRAGHHQEAGTTEKISDGVRSAFKSATGRDVPIQDKQ